jgi:hypothetical protein
MDAEAAAGELSKKFAQGHVASTKCESGEPPTIYFVGAFFVLTMPLPER